MNTARMQAIGKPRTRFMHCLPARELGADVLVIATGVAGSLDQIDAMLAGHAGTQIRRDGAAAP